MNDVQSIKEIAKSLVGDGDNVEYTRGVCELIAYITVEGEDLPSDIVDKITEELIK